MTGFGIGLGLGLSLAALDPSLVLSHNFAAGSLGGVTFTRASPGTYYDSAGVLQEAAIDVPRFDYDPATGELLGLLIEGEAENSNLRSEELDHTNYISARASIDANTHVAPDGTTTMDSILETVDNNTHHHFHAGVTAVIGEIWTQSVYVKKLGRQYVSLTINDTSGNFLDWATFDLDAGTVESTSAGALDATIQDVGGGTFRISMSQSVLAVSMRSHIWVRDTTGNPAVGHPYVGDITKGVVAWGWQFEKGTRASSYIKTVALAVTRNADFPVELISALDFNLATGTLLVGLRYATEDATRRVILAIDDGGLTDQMVLELDTSRNVNFVTTDSVGADGLVSGTAVTSGDTLIKAAAAYANNDIIMAVDGSLETGDATALFPATDAPTTIRYGHDSAGNHLGGHLAQAKIFNDRKSNTDLTALSA